MASRTLGMDKKSYFKQFPEISRITKKDFDLFDRNFKKESPKYANSWMYLLRSSRNEFGDIGYKYSDNSLLFGIGVRDNTIYFSRIHGIKKDNVKNLVEFCNILSDKLELPIVLKKQDLETIDLLSTHEGFETSNKLGLMLDDELYPEQVIDLDDLFTEDLQINRKAKRLRLGVNRFKNKGVSIDTLDDFRNININEAVKILFNLSKNSISKYYSYLPMIRGLDEQKWDNKRYLAAAYFNNSLVKGFYIAERLDSDDAGLYCALTSADIGGITEYLDASFFSFLYQKHNIKKLYLGGSENQGIAFYVNKLLPQCTSYRTVPLFFLSKRSLKVAKYRTT